LNKHDVHMRSRMGKFDLEQFVLGLVDRRLAVREQHVKLIKQGARYPSAELAAIPG